jgi:hypothetical protein
LRKNRPLDCSRREGLMNKLYRNAVWRKRVWILCYSLEFSWCLSK